MNSKHTRCQKCRENRESTILSVQCRCSYCMKKIKKYDCGYCKQCRSQLCEKCLENNKQNNSLYCTECQNI